MDWGPYPTLKTQVSAFHLSWFTQVSKRQLLQISKGRLLTSNEELRRKTVRLTRNTHWLIWPRGRE